MGSGLNRANLGLPKGSCQRTGRWIVGGQTPSERPGKHLPEALFVHPHLQASPPGDGDP